MKLRVKLQVSDVERQAEDCTAEPLAPLTYYQEMVSAQLRHRQVEYPQDGDILLENGLYEKKDNTLIDAEAVFEYTEKGSFRKG